MKLNLPALTFLFLSLSLSLVSEAQSIAPADGPNKSITWPSQFTLSCGDWASKPVFDARDPGAMVNLDLKGSASLMDSSQMPGFKSSDVVYHIDITLNDATMTGLSTPISTSFTCYFDSASIANRMKCNDNFKTIPGIQNFSLISLAGLSQPDPMSERPGSMAFGPTISIRRSVHSPAGDRIATRYYDQVREFTCAYSR